MIPASPIPPPAGFIFSDLPFTNGPSPVSNGVSAGERAVTARHATEANALCHKDLRVILSLIPLSLLACGEPGVTSPTATPTAPPEGEASPTDAPATSTPDPGDEIVAGAPTFDASPDRRLLGAQGAITALAPWDGGLFVGTDRGAYALRGDQLTAVAAYDFGGSAVELGAVTAVAPREDGLLVAAEAGLYYTHDHALVASGLDSLLPRWTVLDVSVRANAQGDEQVWVATNEGLYFVDVMGTVRVTLPGVTGSPRAVAAGADAVAVAFSSGLVRLHPDTAEFSLRADLDVSAVEIEGGRIWAATGAGIYTGDVDGPLTHYLLGEASPAPAAALALAPGGGALTVAAGGVVHLQGGAFTGVSPYAAAATALAVDPQGDVWVGSGSSLTGLSTGEPVSFSASISPIFSASCGPCHLEGTLAPKHDFSRYEEVEPMADDLLTRVLSGQMPTTGPLPPAEYAAVELWAQTGMAP